MTGQSVIIVDDKQDMLRLLERIITAEFDVEVQTVDNAKEALDIIDSDPAGIVLADIKMPGMDGMELLRRIKESNRGGIVILMTAFGTIDTAVEALKLGAYDFVTKPFDEERLLHTMARALEHLALMQKTRDLEQRIREKETVERFIGQSAPIERLVETIRLVARTDVTVLITGETGTGKDLAARMVHALSKRSDRPFVAVNCPAIPENILESELFGYRKGAFTGATDDRDGLLQTANGGTVFLDEIGDISTALQAKLLRVLQEKEIKPLGDTRTREVDIRVISSTNRNLKEKIAQGTFREDLYYRLNVVSVETPPLREISADIPLIAKHFLECCCSESGIPQKSFSESALRALVMRKWNGNVRELQNEIRRAVIFSRGETIGPEEFSCESLNALCEEESLAFVCNLEYREARRTVLEKFNVQYITNLLKEFEGNVSLAAKKARIERQSLQQLMKKYGIRAGEFKKDAIKT